MGKSFVFEVFANEANARLVGRYAREHSPVLLREETEAFASRVNRIFQTQAYAFFGGFSEEEGKKLELAKMSLPPCSAPSEGSIRKWLLYIPEM